MPQMTDYINLVRRPVKRALTPLIKEPLFIIVILALLLQILVVMSPILFFTLLFLSL